MNPVFAALPPWIYLLLRRRIWWCVIGLRESSSVVVLLPCRCGACPTMRPMPNWSAPAPHPSEKWKKIRTAFFFPRVLLKLLIEFSSSCNSTTVLASSTGTSPRGLQQQHASPHKPHHCRQSKVVRLTQFTVGVPKAHPTGTSIIDFAVATGLRNSERLAGSQRNAMEFRWGPGCEMCVSKKFRTDVSPGDRPQFILSLNSACRDAAC